GSADCRHRAVGQLRAAARQLGAERGQAAEPGRQHRGLLHGAGFLQYQQHELHLTRIGQFGVPVMRKPSNRRRRPWAARLSIFRRLRKDESGQSLVLVTMIGVMATLMMTTATTALTTQIKPAKASVDSGEATAAAQAGLESFLSWVNTNCPPTSGFLCSALATGITNKSGLTDPANQQGVVLTGGDGVASAESYWWTVTYAVSGFARVKSFGQVPTNKTNPMYLTKTLVADVDSMPSFNYFQYNTKYETYSSEFVDNFYRARTVKVTGAASRAG